MQTISAADNHLSGLYRQYVSDSLDSKQNVSPELQLLLNLYAYSTGALTISYKHTGIKHGTPDVDDPK